MHYPSACCFLVLTFLIVDVAGCGPDVLHGLMEGIQASGDCIPQNAIRNYLVDLWGGEGRLHCTVDPGREQFSSSLDLQPLAVNFINGTKYGFQMSGNLHLYLFTGNLFGFIYDPKGRHYSFIYFPDGFSLVYNGPGRHILMQGGALKSPIGYLLPHC